MTMQWQDRRCVIEFRQMTEFSQMEVIWFEAAGLHVLLKVVETVLNYMCSLWELVSEVSF